MWGVQGRALLQTRLPNSWGVRPRPTTHWLCVRGPGAWGPVTNPTACALASWRGALWGRHEGTRGGVPLAWVWGDRCRVLSHPRLPVLWGMRPGPTTHWLLVRGLRRGDPPPAHSARSCELALRAVAAATGRPGGRLFLGLGHLGLGALTLPTARPLKHAAGAHYRLAVGAGAAGVGTRHQPHKVRSCVLAWHTVWAARERPGGGFCLAWVWGVPNQVPSQHQPPVLLGVRPGPTTHWLWVREVRAWGPFTYPTAGALASCLCALLERHEGARGGRLLPGCGASGVGRSFTLDCPSFGACCRGPLPNGRECRGAGVGTRHQPHSARSCGLALRAAGAAQGHPGGRLLPGYRASGVGRSPTPDRPSFGACGRGPLATGCGCRGCGRGDPSPTPHGPLLRAGFSRCGGGSRAPGGGASCLGVGRLGSGALPRPTTHYLGCAAGAATHWLWVGCAGVGASLSLAPPPVPQFVVCCARFLGLQQPVAVVAWHLSSCRGCRQRCASLACLVAPRWCAAPPLVRSLWVLRSAFLSPCCLPPPRGLSPPALLGDA